MENGSLKNIISIKNKAAVLEVSADGGAITSFRLLNNETNPLSFEFSHDDMPLNNRKGEPFRGHFACIGRWGSPSLAEMDRGIPDHGDFVAIPWSVIELHEDSVIMEATSELEGLHVRRLISFHPTEAIINVSEEIRNINHLSRPFNIVQHPTIAAPFLHPALRVFCNAGTGYYYESYENYQEATMRWPQAMKDNQVYDLSFSYGGETGVHSFAINENEEFGWVCAVSGPHRLTLGYVWEKSDYPWINHWCDYVDGVVRYRGLEFGTTGMHQPFPVMFRSGHFSIYGQPVLSLIDAGETVTKKYTAFLASAVDNIHDIRNIKINNGKIEGTINGRQGMISCI